jgi:hypothetical protein
LSNTTGRQENGGQREWKQAIHNALDFANGVSQNDRRFAHFLIRFAINRIESCAMRLRELLIKPAWKSALDSPESGGRYDGELGRRMWQVWQVLANGFESARFSA